MSVRVAGKVSDWLDRLALARWSRTADAAATLDPGALKRVRRRARSLQQRVDRLLHIADDRLSLPRGNDNARAAPLNTDWAWRPELWSTRVRPQGAVAVATSTRFGAETTLFHDCGWSEASVRQIRNASTENEAAFGARIDVLGFDGSYLSLVLELPPEAVDGLSRDHVIGLEARVATERPLELFARLNVRHGPNTEQIVREVPECDAWRTAEFDLAYSEVNVERVERAWLDLIFERPAFNEIHLEDVVLTRRLRAAL